MDNPNQNQNQDQTKPRSRIRYVKKKTIVLKKIIRTLSKYPKISMSISLILIVLSVCVFYISKNFLKDSPKKNLFHLKMIKEIDEWKFLSNDFQNVVLGSDDSHKIVCLEKGSIAYCFKKEEDQKRYFIKCQSDDSYRCSVYGKSFKEYLNVVKSRLIFKIGDNSFISDKESQDEKTIITLYSEDKKKTYGKIIISGQGNSMKEATEVEIFNYNGFTEIENLVLIAARNLVSYENKRNARKNPGQLIVSVGNYVFGATRQFVQTVGNFVFGSKKSNKK